MAKEFGLTNKLSKNNGKTPEQTLGARLYVDIKDNGEKSEFVQVSKRPAKFNLSKFSTNSLQEITVCENISNLKNNDSNFHERDLHQLLTNFVVSAPDFKCYTKTIFHENSRKQSKGINEWLHPDIVGIHYLFEDYDKTTINFINKK